MPVWPFAAALASAIAHALWNALPFRRAMAGDALFGIIVATAIVDLVALLALGFPGAAAWPWIVAAAVINIVYFRAAMAAYDATAYAIAYPILRGIIPPLMYMIGLLWFNERTSFYGFLGMLIVLISIFLFAFQAIYRGRKDVRGIFFALLSGLAVTSSLICDIEGIRRTSMGLEKTIQYGLASSMLSAVALTIWCRVVEGKQPFAVLKREGWLCYLGGTLLTLSFVAGVWAYAQGPIGLVAPVRETNLLWAGVLAFLLVGERVTLTQWMAIGMATGGGFLIRFG